MKKTMMIAALTLMSATAFASKARINALQLAQQIDDIQDVFEQPNKISQFGDVATFEFGTASTNTNNVSGAKTAEGGFLKKSGDSSWGAYLGRKSTNLTDVLTFGLGASNNGVGTAAQTSQAAVLGQIGTPNPISLLYGSKAGDMPWGVHLYLAQSDRKSTDTTMSGPGALTNANLGTYNSRKSSAYGVAAGVAGANWDAEATVGLASEVKGTIVTPGTFVGGAVGDELKFTGKTTAKVSGGYKMDSLYIYGNYRTTGGKVSLAGTTTADIDINDYRLGVVNSHIKDGTNFFYGVSYTGSTQKDNTGGGKLEATGLPAIIGLETEAATWLVLRASVTQNILLGSTRATPPTGTTAPDAGSLEANNTVAAGLGFKWGRTTLDAALIGATTGVLGTDGATFASNASLTYNW